MFLYMFLELFYCVIYLEQWVIMNDCFFFGLFLLFTVNGAEAFKGTGFSWPLWMPQPDVCNPGPKGRVDWLLHVRDSDYGWREHTHRANIALAVNKYRGDDDEMRKMGLQLEVELTRALFRNVTAPILDSDLALYIHALLATNKNPRNFHGTDLVADLLHRVESALGQVNPYLVLALCNSHVVKYEHLRKLRNIANRGHNETRSATAPLRGHPDVDSREAQLKALAFKAFACGAQRRGIPLNKFAAEMETIINCLQHKYNDTDGTFGNVYTTSLAFQAFTAGQEQPRWWDQSKTLAYLERESEIEVNLIKAYYIEMALNARSVPFLHQLYNGVPLPASPPTSPDSHYVSYTVKKSHMPDSYISLTLKVEERTNFYEIMKIASHVSGEFNFSDYRNNNGDPMVYSVSGIPNDAEENLFWRLCRQYDVDHSRETSEMRTFEGSPARLVPKKDERLTYVYGDLDCPVA